MTEFPQLRHTVLDTTDVRGLAEFYRRLLGLRYRPGDEPAADGASGGAPDGAPDGAREDVDWLTLTDGEGRAVLAFQLVDRLERTTWPEPDVPMQLHLDLTVPDRDSLDRQHARALELGAELLLDRTDDPDEPLYVYADPAGHPFCIFVA